MEETQKTVPDQNVDPGSVLTPEQITEHLKFVGLSSCGLNTTFLNIPYDFGKGGRILLVLGQIGFHGRAKMTQKHVQHDEQLAMDKVVETNPDTIISARKEDCRTIILEASYPEYDRNRNLSEEERNKLPAKVYSLKIVCTGANFIIPGLNKKAAFMYRAIIWQWMNQ